MWLRARPNLQSIKRLEPKTKLSALHLRISSDGWPTQLRYGFSPRRGDERRDWWLAPNVLQRRERRFAFAPRKCLASYRASLVLEELIADAIPAGHASEEPVDSRPSRMLMEILQELGPRDDQARNARCGPARNVEPV